MRDWRALVRVRVSVLTLSPTTEMDVVDELAQHLEDRYQHAIDAGLTEHEAAAVAEGELTGATFLADLADALDEE